MEKPVSAQLIMEEVWMNNDELRLQLIDCKQVHIDAMTNFAKYWVKYALEQAAEKAFAFPILGKKFEQEVDRDSIINSFDYNEIQ